MEADFSTHVWRTLFPSFSPISRPSSASCRRTQEPASPTVRSWNEFVLILAVTRRLASGALPRFENVSVWNFAEMSSWRWSQLHFCNKFGYSVMAFVAHSDAIGAIADFFEVAIHQIIYIRGVYPEGRFLLLAFACSFSFHSWTVSPSIVQAL